IHAKPRPFPALPARPGSDARLALLACLSQIGTLGRHRLIGADLVGAEFKQAREVAPLIFAEAVFRILQREGPGIDLSAMVVADADEIDAIGVSRKNEPPGEIDHMGTDRPAQLLDELACKRILPAGLVKIQKAE